MKRTNQPADFVENAYLELLIRELGGPLRLFAAQWTDSPDDVVQEAFIDLVALEHAPDRPAAWLYRVVRNRAVSAQRSILRRRRRERKATAERRQWFEAGVEQTIDAQRCTEFLEQLSRIDRAIVIARIWADLSFEEIGTACSISASTACRRYGRAIKELRGLLDSVDTKFLPMSEP